MMMPGRKYQAGSTSYRYSINGQEKSDELNENLTTAEYWEYDSRVGRRWNVDPITKSWESPYAVFSNNPVLYSDPKGNNSDVKYHTVQKKDTYSSLAKKYGVTVNQLRQWNGYEDGGIPLGAELIVAFGKNGGTGGNGYDNAGGDLVLGITTKAESLHKEYVKLQEKYKNGDKDIQYDAVNGVILMKMANNYLPDVPGKDKMDFVSLFRIWFFEMDNGVEAGKIVFGKGDKTTEMISHHEGVTEAQNLALSKLAVGNLTNTSHTWIFGVRAFKQIQTDGLQADNSQVAAFLGSYTVNIQTQYDPVSNSAVMHIIVMNTSGWESATRFRKDNDGNGSHDGIIPNSTRHGGLGIGGTLDEEWHFNQYVPSFIINLAKPKK